MPSPRDLTLVITVTLATATSPRTSGRPSPPGHARGRNARVGGGALKLQARARSEPGRGLQEPDSRSRGTQAENERWIQTARLPGKRDVCITNDTLTVTWV